MAEKQAETDWYWEVLISCPIQSFDLVSFYLFEYGASGVEEVAVDNRVRTDRVFLPASVSDPVALIEGIAEQLNVTGDIAVKINMVDRKPFQDWQNGWQTFFKPVEIGESFVVRPPWEPPFAGKKEIVIQPGQGFGTGYHESTHLALLLLEWAMTQCVAQTVTDIGTGSGILTIAALLLGARQLIAVDLDGDALAEVPNNLALSGLDRSAVELFQCGPDALKKQAELVVVNIEGHILEHLADDLTGLVSDGGRLILSGVLTERKASLLDAYKPQLEPVHTLEMNEWTGFVLQKNRIGSEK